MRSHRWKSPLEQAGHLRRITAGWLRGEGIPPGLYLPGDTVIVETRRQIRSGEIVVAELAVWPFSAADREDGRTRREGEPLASRACHTGGRAVAERLAPAAREAIYLHTPGAAMVRFAPPDPAGRSDRTGPTAVSLQIPASDLVIVGVVIGLRRAL